MAWTQADADAIRVAITELATGKRTVTVSYGGPPARTRSFGIVQLGELRALLAEMQADLQRAAGGATFRLASTRKGL